MVLTCIAFLALDLAVRAFHVHRLNKLIMGSPSVTLSGLDVYWLLIEVCVCVCVGGGGRGGVVVWGSTRVLSNSNNNIHITHVLISLKIVEFSCIVQVFSTNGFITTLQSSMQPFNLPIWVKVMSHFFLWCECFHLAAILAVEMSAISL